MTPKPELLDLSKIALFLDFDGTIARLEERPDEVVPEKHRTQLLKKLHGILDGRLALVSGREIAVLDFLTQDTVPALGGVHGLQRRTASGVRDDTSPHPAIAECLVLFKKLQQAWPELIIEDKGVSIAVHFRQCPDAEAPLRDSVQKLATQHGLLLQEGRAVIELKTPGRHKGDVIACFMDEIPFKGFRPVFVGDDVTDEAGFNTVNHLGGLSVKVGEPPSRASCYLANVEAVLTWLEECCYVTTHPEFVSHW